MNPIFARTVSLAIVALLPTTTAQTKTAFTVGERMEYEVRFGPVKVGNGHMEIVGVENIRGRGAFHTAFWVQGGTFFYKVNDVYESWIDTASFSSLRFVQQLEEGTNEKERRYDIYPDRNVYFEMHKKPPREHPASPQPLDDGSFLYFIRTIPLVVGQTYDFNRYFRPDRNPVRIRVLRREKVTVPAGMFNAIVIQPVIKTTGIFSENGQALIWLSDDDRKIVLQLKSKVSFGSLNLYLKSYFTPTSK
ncbi:MAG: DUF3108 domain-containing protein [Gemmatimonadaceae bacterium]|nr:DUF3108 domain-containing protein [Gemmatimonadaceae bacterium]